MQKENQKTVEEKHVEMIKSHVLDYLKAHRAYTLTELWADRRVAPLAHMTWKEFKSFLNENGCKITKTVTYVISKRR